MCVMWWGKVAMASLTAGSLSATGICLATVSNVAFCCFLALLLIGEKKGCMASDQLQA